jgi:hypothetical protein
MHALYLEIHVPYFRTVHEVYGLEQRASEVCKKINSIFTY